MKARKLFLSLVLLLALGLCCPGWAQAGFLTERWTFTGSQSFLVSGINGSPAVGDDGTIYAGTQNGFVFALHPDGTPKWVKYLGGSFHWGPAIAPNGTIVIHNYDVLYDLRPDDGSIKWQFNLASEGYQFHGAPAVSEGAVYIGSNAGRLFAFVLSWGGKLWEFHPTASNTAIIANPVIDLEGNIFFLYREVTSASHDYQLYKVDRAGKFKSSAGLDFLNPELPSPAIGPDGRIYVAAHSLFAFKPYESWYCALPDLASASPVVGELGPSRPAIAVPINDKLVYIDPNDGAAHIEFTIPLDLSFGAATPAIGQGGMIYVGTSASTNSPLGLLCLLTFGSTGPSTYETYVLDRILLDGPTQSSPAIVKVGSQNVLYIGTQHALSAWNIGVGGIDPGLAHTSWPCDRGNLKRNGRVSVAFSALFSVAQMKIKLDALNLGNYAISLGSKLESAKLSLEREELVPARNKLNAFINEVRAQKGKKIVAREADSLIADAQVIVSMLQ